jgi:FemAB-related protein (PEP-CTERM system-associated)
VPFAPYGGSVAEDNTIEEILVRYGAEITKQVGGDYMELRNKYSDSKLPVNAKYMTLVLELNEDPEVVWKGFNNKVRNAIRNSLKYNLEINEGSIEDFYKLYSKNMRSLGTPTHSRKFFNTVISEFRGKADIQIVQLMGEPVSAAILLYFKDTVISGWAASAREYREFSPNNLLYWDAIKSACEKGYKYFDFGRSIEGSGTYRFKKPWGAQEKQLQYVYYLNRVKYMPDTSQANLKRRQFAKLWQALPLSLTNALGTKLRRNLP